MTKPTDLDIVDRIIHAAELSYIATENYLEGVGSRSAYIAYKADLDAVTTELRARLARVE